MKTTEYLNMSGNVCVPLDPTIEQQNFEYIVQKSEADVCFAEKRVLSRITTRKIKTVTKKNLLQLTANQNPFSIPEKFDANLPAQIIFTSGSTGLPKGVVLSHKNYFSSLNTNKK